MGRKALSTLLLLFAVGMVLPSARAYAVVTPAGTQIRNRSSATYQDMGGNSYAAISNEVITVVLPVYGVSILPDDSGESPPVTPAFSQNALAGSPVYARYDLTNTGNDNDTFSLVPLVDPATTMSLVASAVTIYHDLNGNGIVNAGEPVISSGGVPGNIGPLSAGQTVSIILSYTVPPGASSGDVAYVGVEGASIGDGTTDTGNYHLTTVVNDAVMSANLNAVPAIVFGGNQITYTLSGTNVGNQSANGTTVTSVGLTGVLLYDVIPVDPSSGNPLAVSGVPTGTPVGGSVVYLPSGSSTAGSPETWPWSLTSNPGDIAVGYVTNGAITAGQGYTFGYQVTVPAGMSAGVIGNTASLAYIDNDGGTPDPTIVVSNNANVTVGTTADVLIGPSGNPGAGSPPNYNDDVQSVATAYAGTTVDFTNTVRNDGNASDQVNVLVDGSSTIPAGWTVFLLHSDGVTPLSDSGSDALVDVGPLAAGDSVDIIVRLVIPGNQAAGGPFDAVIRAQSTNTPAVFNLTTDRIGAVVAAGVNIGNFNGGAGTNDGSVNQNANPGTSVDFALDVINTSGGLDSYTLSRTAPAGWTVTFYSDANNNGVLDAGETAPIVSVGPVAAFAEVHVIAHVTIPAGTAPGVNGVSFAATSANNGATSDTIADTVTINSAASVDFAPDLSGTGTPSGTVSYTHTLTNTGNVSDTFNLSYVSSQGWPYTFYDVGNNPIASVALVPGASATVIVRLSIPGTATIGMVETGTLTATGAVTSATDNATDVTVITAGELELTKAVSPLGNQVPGTELTYTTDYRNIGTDSLTTIVILDAIPAFTQFKVGSAASGTPPAAITAVTPSYSNDGGLTWTYSPVSGGGGAPANFDATVTNVRFVMTGVLEPGAASTIGVGFVVRIIAE